MLVSLLSARLRACLEVGSIKGPGDNLDRDISRMLRRFRSRTTTTFVLELLDPLDQVEDDAVGLRQLLLVLGDVGLGPFLFFLKYNHFFVVKKGASQA